MHAESPSREAILLHLAARVASVWPAPADFGVGDADVLDPRRRSDKVIGLDSNPLETQATVSALFSLAERPPAGAHGRLQAYALRLPDAAEIGGRSLLPEAGRTSLSRARSTPLTFCNARNSIWRTRSRDTFSVAPSSSRVFG